MQRFPSLTQTILTALLSAGACSCPDNTVYRDYTLETSDTKYTQLIDDCLAEDLSCEKLCYSLLSQEERDQQPAVVQCQLDLLDKQGQAEVQAMYDFPVDCGGAGRRPEGSIACTQSAPDACTQWLAAMTTLEAAAVYAFVEVARDLLAHGAPHDLVVRALAAADDEVRHTAIMRALARSRGTDPMLPQWTPAEPSSLLQLARLNATEGCIRETYGASMALWQSRHCADEDMRLALAEVAHDEIQHAQLSAEIHQWIWPRLNHADQEKIKSEQKAAVVELLTAAQKAPGDPLLGLPSTQEATKIIQALFA